MGRVLLVVAELALLVYCLIDCAQADTTRVRNLPKLVWLLLIILIPVVGSIAWLVAGRPQRDGSGPRGGGGPRPPAPRGPDDDPDFLRSLRLPRDPDQPDR